MQCGQGGQGPSHSSLRCSHSALPPPTQEPRSMVDTCTERRLSAHGGAEATTVCPPSCDKRCSQRQDRQVPSQKPNLSPASSQSRQVEACITPSCPAQPHTKMYILSSRGSQNTLSSPGTANSKTLRNRGRQMQQTCILRGGNVILCFCLRQDLSTYTTLACNSGTRTALPPECWAGTRAQA